MKLSEYVEQAEAIFASVRDGIGRVQSLAISKLQMNAIVPQEMDDEVPKWRDHFHMEMIVYPFRSCGWYFKINRHYYPSNNKVGYIVNLISSDIKNEQLQI